MNNMNIDENTMKNIKNMVDNGNISEAISNISPEMIQNFSKILSNQNNNNSTNFNTNTNANINTNSNSNNNVNTNTSSQNTTNSNNNFNMNGLDMNTIMKMSSVIQKMNNSKNDPRANLLKSLKPYLRDGKKEKLDNYINLLNVSRIAEIMKENNNEKHKGE